MQRLLLLWNLGLQLRKSSRGDALLKTYLNQVLCAWN
eukprot:SAG22_NODE_10757_length_517_cov_1.559809_1_plen_36_part_01